MVKICKRCEIEKSLDDFYKHSGMSDGHLNICKTCKKTETKEREKQLRKNPEWVEKEKKRGREKYHKLYSTINHPLDEDYNRIWMTDEERALKRKKVNENYIKNYPEKRKAKNSSQRISCPKGFHRHHWSYNEEHWKDVIILESKEHSDLHRFIEYDKSFYYRTAINIGKFKRGDLLDTREKHLEFLEIIKQTLL